MGLELDFTAVMKKDKAFKKINQYTTEKLSFHAPSR